MSDEDAQDPLKKIFDFVYKHRLAFHPTTHVLKKIESIAANNFQCICDPTRTCPCEQSIQEIKEKGWCKCRLLCSYKAGHNYLLEYGYIDADGNIIK